MVKQGNGCCVVTASILDATFGPLSPQGNINDRRYMKHAWAGAAMSVTVEIRQGRTHQFAYDISGISGQTDLYSAQLGIPFNSRWTSVL